MLNEKLNVCLGVKSTNTMQLNIRKDIKRRKPDVVFECAYIKMSRICLYAHTDQVRDLCFMCFMCSFV